MQALWWSMLIISVIVFVVLVGYIFPRVFFKAGYQISSISDRGLKNYNGKSGRSIVYAPKLQYKKYISQYILSERNGKKVMLCKLDKSVSFINYDIYIFNNKNKVFKVISVKDYIEKCGYSKEQELPSETNYVTLIVNCVNDIIFTNDTIVKVSNRRIVLFALAMGLLIILEIFLIKLCLANLFADVFVQTFMMSIDSVFITVGIGFVAAFLGAVPAIFYFKLKSLNVGGNG